MCVTAQDEPRGGFAPPCAPSAPLRGALVVLALALALLVPATSAAGRSYVPPDNRVFHGVSDTGNVADFRAFRKLVGAHPAVLEDFYHWGTPLTTGALLRWDQTDTRGVLSLSTAPGGLPEVVSPGQIASGKFDDYILGLNRSIANSKQVVYLRLFPEMNGSWNPYCAFNPDGSRRGSNHTTGKFKKAWRRIVVIMRGGKRARINDRLRRLGMARIYAARSNHAPVYRHKDVPRRLPHPKVAFLWNPQTVGSPAVKGNAPGSYFPGRHYVDWVGADIYSKYSSAMPKLTSFYRRWDRWPFFIGEYSPWDNDYTGSFTRQLFDWARHHHRTRMLVYYRSVSANSAYDIDNFPAARTFLQGTLNRSRYMQFAPGTHD
jgi:hypothetical protein